MFITDVIVPFSYRFEYIPPKARNVRSEILFDTASIGVPTVSIEEAPVAFRWVKSVWNKEAKKEDLVLERRWYNDQLWMPNYIGGEDRPERKHMSVEMLQFGLDDKCFSNNPFNAVLRGIGLEEHPRRNPKLQEFLAEKEWKLEQLRSVNHFAEQAIEHLEESDVLIVDGMVWVPGKEPRYHIDHFGSGTGAFVSLNCNSNIHEGFYFNANEYESFGNFANKESESFTGKLMGYLPSKIDVLIPEAIQFRSHFEWFCNKVRSDILNQKPDAVITDEFTSVSYKAGLEWEDTVSSWFANASKESATGFVVRLAASDLNESESQDDPSYEVVKFENDNDGIVYAHVVDKNLADWIAANYKA